MQTQQNFAPAFQAAVQQLRQDADAAQQRTVEVFKAGRYPERQRNALERACAYAVAADEFGTGRLPALIQRDGIEVMLRSYEQRAFTALTADECFDVLSLSDLAEARGLALIVRLLRGVLSSLPAEVQ